MCNDDNLVCSSARNQKTLKGSQPSEAGRSDAAQRDEVHSTHRIPLSHVHSVILKIEQQEKNDFP